MRRLLNRAAGNAKTLANGQEHDHQAIQARVRAALLAIVAAVTPIAVDARAVTPTYMGTI